MTEEGDKGVEKYLSQITGEFEKAFEAANKARAKGLDPENFVEIPPANDLVDRVEKLVGPKGVSPELNELMKKMPRDAAAFEISKHIMEGKYSKDNTPLDSPSLSVKEKEKRIEQAVRTGLALITEAIVSAPIEGVTKVQIRKNSDSSDYVAVFFSGPIRGAGGTGQAFTLLIADYCRKLAKIADYRPTDTEVERYVEESNLYAMRTRAGQYVPTEDEIRHIMRNCPICIDGEPTEHYEVGNHKNVPSIPTNKVRGGMCLVISEGVCLKAAKVMKIAKKAGKLDWSWLEKLIKVTKKDQSATQIKPSKKYIDEIVAGRPIFAYPMEKGGFRLRYGRTPLMGIMSKAIHPATSIILDEFPVFGTQLKIERPGKGCIVTYCEQIEGPTVLLTNGSVKTINSIEQANAVKNRLQKILFLGDLLCNYGDFLKSNHPLVGAGYCEEWYVQELAQMGVQKTFEQALEISASEAIELAKTKGVALAPKYSYRFKDVTLDDLKTLVEAIAEKGKAEHEWFDFKRLVISLDEKAKKVLEDLCVVHDVENNKIVLDKDNSLALLTSLGMLDNKKISRKKFDELASPSKAPLDLVNELAGFSIKDKTGLYIGASMGRPEKAKPRKMKPPVHSLYPIGFTGGKLRSVVKAVKSLREKGSTVIEAEVNIRACPKCLIRTRKIQCPSCSAQTILASQCTKCGKINSSDQDFCSCTGKNKFCDRQQIELSKEFDSAVKTTNFKPDDVKAVIGLISRNKTPEALEKGFLRAKHGIHVFRDGTTRFDATEIPLTHFTPSQAGTSVKQLKKLGYEKDVFGKPLESENQVLELKVQDTILPNDAATYFLKVASFIDDLLIYYYGEQPFYNAKTQDDLLGKQVIAIAPHTSAGIIARVIGFTDVRGLLAHPYLHCACRRNADGDELCYILLMDGLLNFSKSFLPETRGGKMDAPLVLSIVLQPEGVDDEAHAMDRAWTYPLAFYEATLKNANPSEVEMDLVGDYLGKNEAYYGFGFTHQATFNGPKKSKYVSIDNMDDKVKEELELMDKIRAVDSANAAERILLSHFLPDLYGNLRSFGRQTFRCVDCNAKYRRVPLIGKCRKCNGGKLLLTINKGGIEKYLNLSNQLVKRFNLPTYMAQRLLLLEQEINSVFQEEKEEQKQISLADYF